MQKRVGPIYMTSKMMAGKSGASATRASTYMNAARKKMPKRKFTMNSGERHPSATWALSVIA